MYLYECRVICIDVTTWGGRTRWSPKEAKLFAKTHIYKYYVMWKKENIYYKYQQMILVNEKMTQKSEKKMERKKQIETKNVEI